MERKWKVALIAAVILLLAMSISLAWGASERTSEPLKFKLIAEKAPKFTPKDREQLRDYYQHLLGTLAPGSLDHSEFSPAVERALAVGSHVPMQLEKDLQPLPAKLESALSPVTGDYSRYKLGRHVLLVKKADLTITDILKDVGSNK